MAPVESLFVSQARGAAAESPPGAFHCGPENRLVYHVGSRFLDPVSPLDSHSDLPPLVVVYGPPGAGKTHLLRLFVAGLRQHTATVPFPTANDWALSAKHAIRHRRTPQVTPWQEHRLLVLDNIHQFADQISAQRRLVALIDEFQQTGGHMVLGCRDAPWLTGLQGGLISRLMGGLLIPLSPPGFRARQALIDDWARRSGWMLHQDSVRWLAQQLLGTPRTVQQRLVSLMSEFPAGESPSLAMLKRRCAPRSQDGEITPKQVLLAVCREFGLTTRDLTGRTRRRSVVIARAVAIYLMRTLTRYSLEEIGRQVGNRDHSTVLNALRRAEDQLESDLSLRCMVETITGVLHQTKHHDR